MYGGTGNHIDVTAPLGCLELVKQEIMSICPQASLCVYEPGYCGSSSTIQELNDESFNLLSFLESWSLEQEGDDEAMWLNTQQGNYVRPIIFVAHEFGGLVVEQVSNGSL